MKKKQRTDQFKSDEELYFSWWLDELKEEKIVSDWKYEDHDYYLSPKMTTTTEYGTYKLQEHKYTPDFHIYWSVDRVELCKLKLGILVSFPVGGLSLVDVKGGYSNNFNDMRFPLNQKWMMEKLGLYVNKVIPIDGFRINSKKQKVLKKCLFSETFTPKKYLLTPTGKARTIHWKVRSIEQFLEDIR